jgi:Ca2+-binding EF-hand superfamily protein
VDPEHSDEEIIALLKKADNDGSGIIDFDEFHAAVLESHTDDDSKTLDLQELVSSV